MLWVQWSLKAWTPGVFSLFFSCFRFLANLEMSRIRYTLWARLERLERLNCREASRAWWTSTVSVPGLTTSQPTLSGAWTLSWELMITYDNLITDTFWHRDSWESTWDMDQILIGRYCWTDGFDSDAPRHYREAGWNTVKQTGSAEIKADW